jgi:flagellar export protein FliJ
MKSRESVLRLKRFQVQEKARQVSQIDTMIADFSRMEADLDGQIAYEEKKAGITDPEHFAYPTFAKAARQRRENLQTSRTDLENQKEAAAEALSDAQVELAKLEAKEKRDGQTSEAPNEMSDYERAGMIG